MTVPLVPLLVKVVRFIGWLKTAVKLALIGTAPPAFAPGLNESR